MPLSTEFQYTPVFGLRKVGGGSVCSWSRVLKNTYARHVENYSMSWHLSSASLHSRKRATTPARWRREKNQDCITIAPFQRHEFYVRVVAENYVM